MTKSKQVKKSGRPKCMVGFEATMWQTNVCQPRGMVVPQSKLKKGLNGHLLSNFVYNFTTNYIQNCQANWKVITRHEKYLEHLCVLKIYFLNIYLCPPLNKQTSHLCGQHYLEATFNVPEVKSENSICIFIATQTSERMMYTQHAVKAVFFLQPQKENPACVSDVISSARGLLCFQWVGLFPNSKRCVSVFIIPLPSVEIAHAVSWRRSQKGALTQSSEKLCYEWHFQNSTIDD